MDLINNIMFVKQGLLCRQKKNTCENKHSIWTNNEQQTVILHNYVIWKYAESASSEQNNNIVILAHESICNSIITGIRSKALVKRRVIVDDS